MSQKLLFLDPSYRLRLISSALNNTFSIMEKVNLYESKDGIRKDFKSMILCSRIDKCRWKIVTKTSRVCDRMNSFKISPCLFLEKCTNKVTNLKKKLQSHQNWVFWCFKWWLKKLFVVLFHSLERKIGNYPTRSP